MIKYELRVASYELLVVKWKLKSTCWNSKVRVKIYGLQIQIHELRVQIHELQIHSYELRVQNHQLVDSFVLHQGVKEKYELLESAYDDKASNLGMNITQENIDQLYNYLTYEHS